MKRLFIFILTGCTLIGCKGPEATSTAPLIGISSGFNGSSSAGANYTRAVSKAGGIPVIIPIVDDIATAELVVSRLDGIIFSGGEDLDPDYYGEKILNGSVGINAKRDTSDLFLVQAARDCGKPIMGICRGHQLVNVAFGGSLYQDIPTQIGTEHRQDEPGTHNIGLAEGSRIRDILGGVDSIATNTHHHQSVKDIAPGFTVTARTADGVVEAIEGPGAICVQFHPEGLINAGRNEFLPLFKAFVEDCKK